MSFPIDNKHIVKNTVFPDVCHHAHISFYTCRAVILMDTLEETDSGIYNLVGGIVVLFTFMNSAMVSAIQRYLNYEIG